MRTARPQTSMETRARRVLAAMSLATCSSFSLSVLGAESGNPIRADLIYHNYCSVCHGDRGDGNSRARNSLMPPPKNFTDPAASADLTRDRMIAVVSYGKPGTAMVAWQRQLNDADVAAVVDYIREVFMHREASAAQPAAGISGTNAHGGRARDADNVTASGSKQ